MPAITFTNGLITGLDTQALIDAILQVERRPAVLLETRIAQRTGQIAAIKGLSALLVSLKIEADRLAEKAPFEALTVGSSDEEVATGLATSSASPGSYTFTVGSVAQAQSLVSQGFAASSTNVGTGTISIQLGSGSAETITIDAAHATLAGLRDAINASDAEATASLVNTGSGPDPVRLILASKKSGASNTIAFTANLSGGAAPVFASSLSGVTKGASFQGTATFTNVGAAVLGSYAGTAPPTAAGSYTGESNRTFTFQANSAGTLGVDAVTFDWDDGAGRTGMVAVPASYAPGTEITVADGLAVSFGAGAVVGGDSFTIAATGRGAYTGTAGKMYSFTVTTGGQVGVDAIAIDWSDGIGGSGTLDVPAGYTPGTQLAVSDGVVLSLDGGTLADADTFRIDVGSPVLQAAQDATLTLGSSAGGGNPITVTSSTNQFKDFLEGLTVTVEKVSASPVTLEVARDTEGVKNSVLAFVERYNGVIDFLDSQLSYDAELKTKGPLFGDAALLRIDARLRRSATSAVAGITGAYKALTSVGIRSGAKGKLVVDDAELSAALEADLSAVAELFAKVGSTTDADVQFLNPGDARSSTGSASAATASGGYAVTVTRAAERARIAGGDIDDPSVTPIVITSANNVLRVRVNGVLGGDVSLTQQSYAAGSDLAKEIETQINGDTSLGVNRVTVSWVPTSTGRGRFEIEGTDYGSRASVAIETSAGSAWTSALGFQGAQIGVADTGVDVVGTIDGEEAHGEGRVLVGGPEQVDDREAWHTLGVRLLVSLTAAELSAQGAAQGTVTISSGVASLLSEELGQLTDAAAGVLSDRERLANRQIDLLNDQVERIDERVAKRRRLLEAQFARLEQAVAQLQSQGQFLGAQLSNLTNNGNNTSRNR